MNSLAHCVKVSKRAVKFLNVLKQWFRKKGELWTNYFTCFHEVSVNDTIFLLKKQNKTKQKQEKNYDITASIISALYLPQVANWTRETGVQYHQLKRNRTFNLTNRTLRVTSVFVSIEDKPFSSYMLHVIEELNHQSSKGGFPIPITPLWFFKHPGICTERKTHADPEIDCDWWDICKLPYFIHVTAKNIARLLMLAQLPW